MMQPLWISKDPCITEEKGKMIKGIKYEIIRIQEETEKTYRLSTWVFGDFIIHFFFFLLMNDLKYEIKAW